MVPNGPDPGAADVVATLHDITTAVRDAGDVLAAAAPVAEGLRRLTGWPRAFVRAPGDGAPGLADDRTVVTASVGGEEAATIGVAAPAPRPDADDAARLVAAVAAHLATLPLVDRTSARKAVWFDLAEEMAHVAAWQLDPATGEVTISPEFFRIVDRDPASVEHTWEGMQALMHPYDAASVEPVLERRVRGEHVGIVPIRFIRPDGEVRWADTEARLVGDQLVGFLQDVTDLRRTERALRASEERARVVIASAPVGMAIGAADGRILEVNDALRRIFRLPDAPPDQFTVAARVAPEDLALHAAAIEAVGQGDIPQYHAEVRLRRGDGEWMWAAISVASVRDGDGRVEYIIGQVLDISERRAAEAQLRAASDELRSANRAKNQFLSRVSHELRTPLNAVLGYGQLLALEHLTPDQHEAVDHILHAGGHLLELIDEVLDLARLDAGTTEVEVAPHDLREVIGDALRIAGPMAGDHRIALTVEPMTAAAELCVLADRRRLTQVLVNLVTNAVKYNRPGGRVEVAGARHDDRVRLSVRDTGRGIPATSLAQVFEPFDRLGAEQQGVEGTGIGLALARSLVEHMGGSLTVSSAVGVGSTFTVDLPAAEPDEAMTEAEPKGDDAPVAVVVDVDLDRPIVVLSVEDNPVNQRLIEAIVRLRPGVELHHAADGGSGVARALELRPDVVLLDMHLPDVPGTEVLAQLLDHVRPAPTVVVVSADASPDRIAAATDRGAHRYLTKPVDVRALLAVLDEVAGRVREVEGVPGPAVPQTGA